MAFFQCHFFSDVLAQTVAAHVLLPQRTARQIGLAGSGTKGGNDGKFPVLYLLHGLSDDHTTWMRRTSIERYAAAKNLAIVMPGGGRSFYQDMASGPRYWTFLSQELPALMQGFFPLATERERTFAAGLSMGGYGALRLALAHPERYAAAAGLSGALDIVGRYREGSKPNSLISQPELEGIFGRSAELAGGDGDLWHLARQAAGGTAPQPKLFLACGTEDGLLGQNRAFHRHLEELSFDLSYLESPGTHEWGYWDEQIQKVLNWLPLPA